MGYYINKINDKLLPNRKKVQSIIENVPGALIIEPPTQWQEGLICVVHNSVFDAAAYAFDESEMNVFWHQIMMYKGRVHG